LVLGALGWREVNGTKKRVVLMKTTMMRKTRKRMRMRRKMSVKGHHLMG